MVPMSSTMVSTVFDKLGRPPIRTTGRPRAGINDDRPLLRAPLQRPEALLFGQNEAPADRVRRLDS